MGSGPFSGEEVAQLRSSEITPDNEYEYNVFLSVFPNSLQITRQDEFLESYSITESTLDGGKEKKTLPRSDSAAVVGDGPSGDAAAAYRARLRPAKTGSVDDHRATITML